MPPPETDVRSVDAATVKSWLDRHEALLVDVRETPEFEREHIPGALLLPLSTLDPEVFPSLPGKTVVLHCAVGKRSEAAGKMLLNEGHLGIIHMTGGLDAWKAAGFATEIQILPPGDDAPVPQFLCPAPGTILRDEFMKPHKIAPTDLAVRLGVHPDTVADLLAGNSAVTVEMSLRLARYFSTAADFWLRLQMDHDLEQARYRIGENIRREIRPRTAPD